MSRSFSCQTEPVVENETSDEWNPDQRGLRLPSDRFYWERLDANCIEIAPKKNQDEESANLVFSLEECIFLLILKSIWLKEGFLHFKSRFSFGQKSFLRKRVRSIMKTLGIYSVLFRGIFKNCPTKKKYYWAKSRFSSGQKPFLPRERERFPALPIPVLLCMQIGKGRDCPDLTLTLSRSKV